MDQNLLHDRLIGCRTISDLRDQSKFVSSCQKQQSALLRNKYVLLHISSKNQEFYKHIALDVNHLIKLLITILYNDYINTKEKKGSITSHSYSHSHSSGSCSRHCSSILASGLTSSFSKYEKLGVNTQFATLDSSCPSTLSGLKAPCWTVNLGGQNTG